MTNVNCIFFTSSGVLWCLEFYAAPDKKTGALGPWSISLSIIWIYPPEPCPVTIVITKPHQAKITDVFELEKLPINLRLNRKSNILGKLGGERKEKMVAHFAENVESSELLHPYVHSFFLPKCVVHPMIALHSVIVIIIHRMGPSVWWC